MSMNKSDFKNVLICKEKLSPYWIAQWTYARGKRIRRSTKVPVKGGSYKSERLSTTQAERRALMVAFELAQAVEDDYKIHDNRSVRQICDVILSGSLLVPPFPSIAFLSVNVNSIFIIFFAIKRQKTLDYSVI